MTTYLSYVTNIIANSLKVMKITIFFIPYTDISMNNRPGQIFLESRLKLHGGIWVKMWLDQSRVKLKFETSQLNYFEVV